MECRNLWDLWKPCVDALKNTTSPDPNIEEACKRLVDVCCRKEKILALLRRKHTNEIQFNFFVATQIIQPLSGGICMVNRMPYGSSAGTKVVPPQEIGVRGLGIGKKNLLLSSNKLRVVTKTQTSDPEKLRPRTPKNSVPWMSRPLLSPSSMK